MYLKNQYWLAANRFKQRTIYMLRSLDFEFTVNTHVVTGTTYSVNFKQTFSSSFYCNTFADKLNYTPSLLLCHQRTLEKVYFYSNE